MRLIKCDYSKDYDKAVSIISDLEKDITIDNK
jgi:hypothetical protein